MDATGLAIVITQGVVWYCRLVRGAKHDVKELERSALRTQQICKSIEERLEETPDDDKVKKNVQDALEDCRENIERLEKQLKKSGMGEDREGWKKMAQELKSKALYPIRSDGLKKMSEECNSVNNKLFQALQLFSLDRMDDNHTAAMKQAELLQLGLEDLKVTAEATNDAIISMRQDATMKEAIEWINPLKDHFQLQQRDLKETKALQQDAAQPIIDADIFQEWYTGSSKRLWCHGAPGVGKTILTSILVEYLRDPQNLDSSLAYLYCNYQYEKKFTPRNLMGSLIQQLSHRSPQCQAIIVERYKKHSYNGTKPSLDELTTLLDSICQKFSRPYILVDGLDEISNDDDNLSTFLEQLLSLEASVSIVILSRDLPEIQSWLEAWPQMQIEASSELIKSYLNTFLTKNFRVQRHFKKNAGLLPLAVQSIEAKADGMDQRFLLARLYVETVVTATTIREFRTMLKTLPSGLDAAYRLLLKRIQTQQAASQAELARKVIMWIARGLSAFQIDELREALSIDAADTEIDEEGMPEEEDIITSCMGLVIIRQVPGEIRTFAFTHYTVQEYLTGKGVAYLELSQEQITLTSLARLRMGTGVANAELYNYCYANWGEHARLSCTSDILGPVLSFLDREGARFCIKHPRIPVAMSMMERNGLHFAASFGLTEVAEALIAKGYDVNAIGVQRLSPIHYAVMNNFIDMAQLLLKHGARIDPLTLWKGTPLHWACITGSNEMVEILLQHGADINMNAQDRGTPLAWAIHGGHVATAEIILERSAAVNELVRNDFSSPMQKTALHIAVETGNLEMVRLLINWKADLQLQDEEGLTPLQRASKERQSDIEQYLESINEQAVEGEHEEVEQQFAASEEQSETVEEQPEATEEEVAEEQLQAVMLAA